MQPRSAPLLIAARRPATSAVASGQRAEPTPEWAGFPAHPALRALSTSLLYLLKEHM